MTERLDYSDVGAEAGLARLQDAMRASGLLMTILPEQLAGHSQPQVMENMPPSMFGLAEISFDAMSDVLSDPDVKMHVVRFTAAATAATVIIQGYRLMGIGGRQKVLAAMIPPGFIESALGRGGFRVPKHDKFTLEDIRTLASKISSLKSEEQVNSLLAEQDPELLAYFKAVSDYVRKGQALELAPYCPEGRCT